MRAVILVLLAAVPACKQAKQEAAPPPADEHAGAVPASRATTDRATTPPAKPAALGAVKLQLTGALEGSFAADAAHCGVANPGASIRVSSRELGAPSDWELTLIVSSEDEWEAPAVVLNMRGSEKASFTYKKQVPEGESASVAKDPLGATLDLTLNELTGSRTIKVTGTIACPP